MIRATLKRGIEAVAWRSMFACGIARAILYRRLALRKVRFVGITGSAGKTTTKTLCTAILSTQGACSSSRGSANNALAVANTLLQASKHDSHCVIEVGGGTAGALTWPLRTFRPDIAVITLVRREHVNASFDLAAIAREKSRLVYGLRADGIAVLNRDEPELLALGQAIPNRVIWVGRDEGATVRLLDTTSRWPEPLHLSVEFEGRRLEVATQLHGTQLTLPVLSALGVAVAAGVPLDQAIAAIAAVEPLQGRMQVVSGSDGVTFVRDDWKAPGWSLQAPLEFIRDARASRKVIIIGTISDYPGSASRQYRKAAHLARECAELVVFIGPQAPRALRVRESDEDYSIQAFPEITAAAKYLAEELRSGDLVLLKGSITDHLSRLVLGRYETIQCWKSRCSLYLFCEDCPQLHAPTATVPDTGSNADPAQELIATESVELPTLLPGTRQLIVGLGNWGPQYNNTPHNMGQAMVDWLAAAHDAAWEPCAVGWIAYIHPAWSSQPMALLKLQGLINNSGPPVHELLSANDLTPNECIVVHDDLDIETGKVRLKRDGGDAGHRGVRSITSALGTDVFTRLRIGVRRSGESTRSASGRVTQPLSSADKQALEPVGPKIEAMLKQHATEQGDSTH